MFNKTTINQLAVTLYRGLILRFMLSFITITNMRSVYLDGYEKS
jgi:hypothetical protein